MNTTLVFFSSRLRAIVLRALGLVIISLALVACSKNGLSGTYESDGPEREKVRIEFRSDDKAIYTVMGIRSEVSYTIDEKYLKLVAGGDSIILDIQDDGTIGSNGITLKKVQGSGKATDK